MPRLTDRDFLENHELLRSHRIRGDTVFARLGLGEQRALFSYYHFHVHCEKSALLEHRRAVTQANPSLPHQAGRALRRWRSLPDQQRAPRQSAKSPGTQQGDLRSFSLAFELRPDPDVKQVARAFMALADSCRHGRCRQPVKTQSQIRPRLTTHHDHPRNRAGLEVQSAGLLGSLLVPTHRDAGSFDMRRRSLPMAAELCRKLVDRCALYVASDQS